MKKGDSHLFSSNLQFPLAFFFLKKVTVTFLWVYGKGIYYILPISLYLYPKKHYYLCMEITIPITLLISLATILVTVGGTWAITQRRIRDLETKVSRQDLKYEQIIIEINSLKVEIAKVQGSITAMNDKFDPVYSGQD